jgi:hypothetical protein
MSTTNPEHSRPPADPVGGLAPIPHGTPLADDHDVSGPPAADTIARGHEIDAYDTTSVFSVPLLVVLFFVLAFGTVSVIFYFIFPNPAGPQAHPLAVEDNKKDVPDRLDNTPSPQLDNFRHLQGHSRSISSPERPTGSSPWIHPEDLRVNPENTPSLYRTGWLDPGKTRARLTIDEAMELAAKKNSKVLKAIPKTAAPQPSQNVPSASNAGRGFGAANAVPPKDPLAPEPKAADGKGGGKGQGKGKGKGKK